jgi:hypothetical protein
LTEEASYPKKEPCSSLFVTSNSLSDGKVPVDQLLLDLVPVDHLLLDLMLVDQQLLKLVPEIGCYSAFAN